MDDLSRFYMSSISPTLSLAFLLSPEIISFPPFELVNFYYLLFASDLCSNLLHEPALFLQSLAVFPSPQCSPFSCVMECTSFAFFFSFVFNKLKLSLSYPWPDVLLWLMTHVLVSSVTEIMECVTAVLGWLLPALALSPACHPRGSCQPLCSPPALHITQAALHSPTPGRYFYSTFLSLRFVLLHASVMTKWGWGGLWQVS